jgi:DNA (cytosine-5)-methyltransferase 1
VITVGSFCSGYGGIEMGLRMALPAAEVAWVAETDPTVSRVLKRQHDVPNLGDITLSPWRGAGGVKILCAGFPCQPVSAAGRQGVTDDHRWLWPDVRRAISELRPGAIFLENVRNLIAVKYDKAGQRGEVFADILRDLRALGYRVRWLVLGACAIGAPHHRHRVFLVAGRVPTGRPVPPAEQVPVLQCGAPRNGDRLLLPTPVARDGDADGRSGRGEGSPEYWARKAAEGRTNGIPLGATVTALLPTPQAHDGRTGSPTLHAETAADRYAAGRRNLEDAAALLLPAGAQPDRWGKYAEAVALWEILTGNPAPEPAERGPKGSLRLAAELPEWMMGLPHGFLTGELSRLDALRAAGNGVLPAQAAIAWHLLTT